MEKFTKNTTLKWTPQEIENPVFIKETVFVFKDFSTKKTLDSHGFSCEFFQISKE